MKYSRSFAAAAAVAVSTFASAAFADATASVTAFYDFLSNPTSEDAAAAFDAAAADNWESIGNYSGKNKNKAGFLGQVGGFGKAVPDLNWKIEAIHNDGDTYIVRSRATGTPAGPMFGIDGEGRGFDILTIDIHHVEGDKIVRTYHVEDWAGAMQQLSGK